MFGQRTSFSIIKLAFQVKHEFYLFFYNSILKYHIFKYTQSIVEIGIAVVKNMSF